MTHAVEPGILQVLEDDPVQIVLLADQVIVEHPQHIVGRPRLPFARIVHVDLRLRQRRFLAHREIGECLLADRAVEVTMQLDLRQGAQQLLECHAGIGAFRKKFPPPVLKKAFAGSNVTPIGSPPSSTIRICSFSKRRSITMPRSLETKCSSECRVIGPCALCASQSLGHSGARLHSYRSRVLAASRYTSGAAAP